MSDPTVFIIDDDGAIRDALSLLLSLKGLRTSIFASAEDFLKIYDSPRRGCLLTDLKMPGMSGLDLQTALSGKGIRLPVVMLTAHGDVPTARTALKNGAVDFLEKPVNEDVLMDVLMNAIRIDAERHEADTQQVQNATRISLLTSRELQVLELLAQGRRHRAIAQRLGISPRTVEVYKGRIMQKLQCSTSADIIRVMAEVRAAQPGAKPAS